MQYWYFEEHFIVYSSEVLCQRHISLKNKRNLILYIKSTTTICIFPLELPKFVYHIPQPGLTLIKPKLSKVNVLFNMIYGDDPVCGVYWVLTSQ